MREKSREIIALAAIFHIFKKKVEKDYFSLGNSLAKVQPVSVKWPRMNASSITNSTLAADTAPKTGKHFLQRIGPSNLIEILGPYQQDSDTDSGNHQTHGLLEEAH